jgi:hypothetical protein
MKKLLGKLFGGPLSFLVPFFGQIRAARDWLTLLAVAGAAAFLYYKFATVRNERDQLRAFAAVTCASAGAEFAASSALDAKGKTVKHKAGELCRGRILELAAFERDATKASNEALAGALADHNRKSEADLASAARNAAAAAAAAQRMEQADNEIQKDDRVGRNWFDALNDLAGLREPKR